MKRLAAIALTGIFLLVSPGPGQAQKEVQPPPIPPMLQGQRPLESPETKEPAPPQKQEDKAAKSKSSNNQKKASVKKPAAKKPQTAKKPPAATKQQAATKKKNQKTSKKKRPAETPQAGPEEG